MPKLVSMKQSPAELKKQMEPAKSPAEQDQYPWGLRLDLNNDVLEKLGMKTMPKVGDTVLVAAEAKVVAVRENATAMSKNRSVELQLTSLGVGKKTNEAKKLYGE